MEEELDTPEQEPIELDAEPSSQKSTFYENIASDVPDSYLSELASRLIDEIETDERSRADWERVGKIGLTYLGYSVEDQKTGSPIQDIKLSSVYDSSLSICWIRFCATARAELLPAAGPCKIKTIGNTNEEIEQKSERVKIFSNHYLTDIDEDYYPDTEKLLAYVGLWGSGFRKVYPDPIDNMPKARFVRPDDIIVDINTTSLLSSTRITHRMELNRREVELLEESEEYLPANLPAISSDDGSKKTGSLQKTIDKTDGITKGISENKNLFTFLEVHTYASPDKIDEKFGGDKKPYVITICKETRKVVCLKRNWEEGDTKFKRKECFVHYYYMPGFGLYGLGIAHLCASNSIAATTLLRQSIDLCSFKNFPAGIRKKSVISEQNNLNLTPGEFKEVQAEEPLSECFMPMPYPDLSPQVLQLKDGLYQQNMMACGVAESKIQELGINAPVGTTLALLEVEKQVTSTVLRFLYNSLKREFKLLFKLFSEYLPDTPYVFSVPGGESSIMRSDFSDDIHIVPVADINALTSAHRMVYAEALLKIAQTNPAIHNIKEVYRRLYATMNVQDVDNILIRDDKPRSLDPISEISYAMQGKKIQAIFSQNHEAHIAVKTKYLESPILQSALPVYIIIQANIQQHKCYLALNKLIEQKIQEHEQRRQEISILPPTPEIVNSYLMEANLIEEQIEQFKQMSIEDIQTIDEVQNMVALMDAEQTKQQIEAEQKQMEEQKIAAEKQLDPNVVMFSEIQQKREEAQLKDKASSLKAETEAFKSQMKYESDMAKIDLERQMSSEKKDAELEIQKIKQQMEQAKMESQENMAEEKLEVEKMKLGQHPGAAGSALGPLNR